MSLFVCPQCAATYRVSRKAEPSEHEPRCEQCDEGFPDDEGQAWLHYRPMTPLLLARDLFKLASEPSDKGATA